MVSAKGEYSSWKQERWLMFLLSTDISWIDSLVFSEWLYTYLSVTLSKAFQLFRSMIVCDDRDIFIFRIHVIYSNKCNKKLNDVENILDLVWVSFLIQGKKRRFSSSDSRKTTWGFLTIHVLNSTFFHLDSLN